MTTSIFYYSFKIFFLFMQGVRTNLHALQLILMDHEVNDQVSLQWSSILATSGFEPETIREQIFQSQTLTTRPPTRWFSFKIFAFMQLIYTLLFNGLENDHGIQFICVMHVLVRAKLSIKQLNFDDCVLVFGALHLLLN